MPNAKTHDLITVVTAVGANVTYFTQSHLADLKLALIFSGVYLFAGYACAGDLDLKSKEYKRWGRLKFLWLPYQKMIPHRSRLSHGILVGGIFRIIYLTTVCSALCWLVLWGMSRMGPHIDPTATTKAHLGYTWSFLQANPVETQIALAGFILAGSAHTIADVISTWFKRKF